MDLQHKWLKRVGDQSGNKKTWHCSSNWEELPVSFRLNICRSHVYLPAPINTSESNQYLSSTIAVIYPYLLFCPCVTKIYLIHRLCSEIYLRCIATINMRSNTFLLPIGTRMRSEAWKCYSQGGARAFIA